ncbi:SDR family NAD(P)-dependent oxidoreductase [Paractinoplanes atraurantiacus]|uniref:3alpha(Or 20beta)-hydroxysteroid dehydrogenase n=1 Tax=Paractinoplanes atraurantiacus TaxID=1036182 RepID=A0A285F0G4_9ACTN|nr:SDR family oxidoreductase [Actinoplanes atraurantiacus]SNY04762.1 3alpha(or 20beta)-hydroxysteroid dehydrogenase [Actinoplanes atraurantiacus]
MRFTDHTVLITGGTGGMGESHVRAFHAEGANVVIGGTATGSARATELAEELGALPVRLDVTSEDDWTTAVAAAEKAYGKVTILINNAGAQNPATPIEATGRALWERTFAVNVTGQFLGIKAVTPAMRRAGGGAIVNIGSTMAYGGTALYASYTAAKWALRGLTRSAALELGRDNIRVNALHPGVIATKLITEPAEPGGRPIADFYDPSPYAIPRLGEPADITAALLDLAAARFTTGTDVVVDGGLLLGPAL